MSSVQAWPRWLRPSTVDVPDNAGRTDGLLNVNALVKRKRPLIYVYDLPPEFNSHLLEVRFSVSQCILLVQQDYKTSCIILAAFIFFIFFQGRHFKFECVNRIYSDQNATLWTEQLYGSQVLFMLDLDGKSAK